MREGNRYGMNMATTILFLSGLALLILAATAHDALQPFSLVMVDAVLPLIATTIAIASWRERRTRKYGSAVA